MTIRLVERRRNDPGAYALARLTHLRRLPSGAVPVKMLNRSLMSPGDLFDSQIEGGGNFLPLERTGGPAPENDCRHAVVIQSRFLDEVGNGNLLLLAKVPDADGHFRNSPSIQNGDSGC